MFFASFSFFIASKAFVVIANWSLSLLIVTEYFSSTLFLYSAYSSSSLLNFSSISFNNTSLSPVCTIDSAAAVVNSFIRLSYSVICLLNSWIWWSLSLNSTIRAVSRVAIELKNSFLLIEPLWFVSISSITYLSCSFVNPRSILVNALPNSSIVISPSPSRSNALNQSSKFFTALPNTLCRFFIVFFNLRKMLREVWCAFRSFSSSLNSFIISFWESTFALITLFSFSNSFTLFCADRNRANNSLPLVVKNLIRSFILIVSASSEVSLLLLLFVFSGFLPDCCFNVDSSSADNALSFFTLPANSFFASVNECFVSNNCSLVSFNSIFLRFNCPCNFSNSSTSTLFPSIISCNLIISSLYFFSMLRTFSIGELVCTVDDRWAILFSAFPKSLFNLLFAAVNDLISLSFLFNSFFIFEFVSTKALLFSSKFFNKSVCFCSFPLNCWSSSELLRTMSFNCLTCSVNCSFSSSKFVPILPARFNVSSLLCETFSCASNFNFKNRWAVSPKTTSAKSWWSIT